MILTNNKRKNQENLNNKVKSNFSKGYNQAIENVLTNLDYERRKQDCAGCEACISEIMEIVLKMKVR